MDKGIHELFNGLAQPGARASVAQALAAALGAQDLALYVRDPELNVMLPAPGMPKTAAGGPLWRSFLARCLTESRFRGTVDWPVGTERLATVLVVNDVAAIIAGGTPSEDAVGALGRHLPLLAALLMAEQALVIGGVEASEAREAAARAHALAKALDASRAAAAELNLQLRREHERKDEFLAMLAHELRNPLSPLVNSVEVLRRGGAIAGESGLRQLDVMSRQLDQLTRLVEDLLDVARVSRGLIELRREALPLAEVLADAVEATRPLIDARNHVLQVTASPDDLYVNGDRVRLTQVFANLLHNAAKYTERGGRIAVNLVCDSGRASVVMRDNGAGIPREMLARVFELFAQAPASLDRTHGGLGIGLTLVRTLVELHGGHVSAHSVGPGHGSTFTVSLPLAAKPPPAREPRFSGSMSAPAAHALHVLVVDDNADAADSLAEVVRFLGAEPIVARDGPQALAAADRHKPDLVLLDIGLPGMDGYEIARRLRDQPGFRARMVALTGYGSSQDKTLSSKAGFDAHLVKPVSAAVIEKMLADLGAMQVAS